MFYIFKQLRRFLITLVAVGFGYINQAWGETGNGTSNRLFIISIGVNEYKDTFWPNLKWAATDADRFAKSIGTGTSQQKITRLLINQEANLENVRATLQKIERGVRPDDLVVLYLSSHGTLQIGTTGEFEPVVVLNDTQNNQLLSTGLAHSELRRWMSGLRAKKKALILATCHSGVGKSKYNPEILKARQGEKGPAIRPIENVSEGEIILAASSRNETAQESDELKGDIYTHYFIEALGVADRNQDGAVSLLEAHDHSKLRTYAYTQGRQRPTIEAQIVGDADFEINGKRKNSGKPLLDAYSQRYEGYSVGLNKGAPIALPIAVPLDEGTNEVVLYPPDNGSPRRFLLNIDKGERVSLNQLFEDAPFAIQLSGSLDLFKSAKLENLTNKNFETPWSLKLSYSYQNYTMALFFLSGFEIGHQPLQNIYSRFTRTLSPGLDFGYTIKIFHSDSSDFYLHPNISIERHSTTLTLKDQTTNESSSATSTHYALGWKLNLRKKVRRSQVGFIMGIGQRFATYNFGLFGSLPANTNTLTVGGDWQFGGIAREIL
jgi:hypothetical protein